MACFSHRRDGFGSRYDLHTNRPSCSFQITPVESGQSTQMSNHRSKISLTTANERVTQTSHLLALVTESHNLAAELVEMVKERDTWKTTVPI